MSDPYKNERRTEQLQQELERLPKRLSWARSRLGDWLGTIVLTLGSAGLAIVLFYIFFGWTIEDPGERIWWRNVGAVLFAGGLFCSIVWASAFPHKKPEEIEAVQKQWARQDHEDDIRWEARTEAAGSLTEVQNDARGHLSTNDEVGALSSDESDKAG